MLNGLHDSLRLRTSPTIFFGDALVIAAFVVLTLVFTELMDAVFADGSTWVIEQLGWFYILRVTVFLLVFILDSGVLAFPTLFSVIWFGIFGMGVFDIELDGGGGPVEAVVDAGDIPGAMFVFLENFPFSTVTSAVGVLIVVLFFITSIDSAALVVGTMGSGGRGDRRGPGLRARLGAGQRPGRRTPGAARLRAGAPHEHRLPRADPRRRVAARTPGTVRAHRRHTRRWARSVPAPGR